ncbi:ARM REPEAT PROTEIN INTERACTING WITH ABF2-like [Syzygium oleosum]|uniref:ARM REPEAT PROTEIN INTERACTING WITH ABF2-like n=1 Tax=Syzygium oleosum TaxID=219896 RepID=UPI0024B92192|nr:ARM REPEAT PROTEIN INTERACTING WITH ABF2-like [Syzygium oleosum]
MNPKASSRSSFRCFRMNLQPPRRIAEPPAKAAAADGAAGEGRVEDALSHPIVLAERVRAAVKESESFKLECAEIGRQVERLSQMLRALARLASSPPPPLYDRPVRRVAAEVARSLERALSLARKCRRQNLIRRLVRITSVTDFRKVLSLLDASVGDMEWLLSVLGPDEPGGGGGGIVLSLPPIASNDPILAWVWSFIASIYAGESSDRVEAANELASLAKDNDRNKKIIVEEGGVPPLLKLLKEAAAPEAQIAAAVALFNLANDQERVRVVVSELGVPLIVKVLRDAPMRVQIHVARLVARMAELDPVAQDDFARENAISPLVSMLSFETFMEDDMKVHLGKQSIHSIIQLNKEKGKFAMAKSNSHLPQSSTHSRSLSDGVNRLGGHRKEREGETPEIKLKLKCSAAEALWMLAKGNVPNSRRITETKGLLCLAKLVEKERDKLQYNCLMTLMEITAAAELNSDLRRAAFKTSSPAAKAVVDQLLRIVKEIDRPSLQIPAIRSIGSLARTFPARETRVIQPLVTQLSHRDEDVATEAAISLVKFACPDNYLCTTHSKAIVEFNGVPPLMRLLRSNERAQLNALILLCYLAIHAGDNEGLERARVLTALEGVDRSITGQNLELRDLISKAVYQIKMYHADVHSHRIHSYSR